MATGAYTRRNYVVAYKRKESAGAQRRRDSAGAYKRSQGEITLAPREGEIAQAPTQGDHAHILNRLDLDQIHLLSDGYSKDKYKKITIFITIQVNTYN